MIVCRVLLLGNVQKAEEGTTVGDALIVVVPTVLTSRQMVGRNGFRPMQSRGRLRNVERARSVEVDDGKAVGKNSIRQNIRPLQNIVSFSGMPTQQSNKVAMNQVNKVVAGCCVIYNTSYRWFTKTIVFEHRWPHS